MTYETTLAGAACSLVIDQGLVPTATLTGGSAIGATYLTAGSSLQAQPFLSGGWLWFSDGTPELPVAIDSVSGAVVTLDFTGDPRTGLVYAHSAGALIATNILDVLPAEPSIMLDNGYPVIYCQALTSVEGWAANLEWQPRVMLSIVYWIKLNQVGSVKQQRELWRRRKSQQAQNDIGTIRAYLIDHPEFTVRGADYAEGIEQFLISNKESIRAGSTSLWEAYLDVQLTGLRDEVIRPGP